MRSNGSSLGSLHECACRQYLLFLPEAAALRLFWEVSNKHPKRKYDRKIKDSEISVSSSQNVLPLSYHGACHRILRVMSKVRYVETISENSVIQLNDSQDYLLAVIIPS